MTGQQTKTAYVISLGVFLSAIFFSFSIFAQQQGPAELNLSGALFDSTGAPIVQSNVNFKVDIWDKSVTCLLYSEQHTGVDLSGSKGAFNLQIGSGTVKVNNLESSSAFDSKLFQNPGVVAAFPGCASGLTLASGEDRVIRISYDLGSGFVTMTGDVLVVSAPYAMVAETLQGKAPTDLIQVHNDATNALTQSNAEYVFSVAKYPNLKALVDGTSSQYMVTSPTAAVNFNGQQLTGVADPTSASQAATKNYDDSNLGGKPLDVTGVGLGTGGGKTLVWDQVQNKWVTSALGSLSSLTAGNGLLGGTITTAGTISVDVGTLASKILQLNASAQIPAVDGSLLTNLNAAKLQARAVSAAAPGAGQVLAWNSSSAQWEPTSPVAAITALTGDVVATGPGSVAATIQPNAVTSAKINNVGVAVNQLLITDAATGSTVTYAVCGMNQILQWTGTGWACTNVSAVLGNSGVVAGSYGSNTQVPQVTVDAQGRVTALTNINIAFPVTSVAGRTGAVTLLASDISGLGTAATKDVGVAPNNVVQLSGTSQLPVVDGSQLTNINATKLQSRTLASTAPSAGQFIGWNVTTSQWEPTAGSGGSVIGVVSGTGLVAGTIATYGTIDVDVGTTAGKIVQLNGSAQFPAIDSTNLYNVNATKIGTRMVSAAAPGVGTVLGWNSSTTQWEPTSATAGSVTSVVSGAGLVAGTIAATGTLNVDVGTLANQIVQLDSSARLPQVDGGLVSNINAVKLQGTKISTTAPTGNQVLTYNSTTTQWEAQNTSASGTSWVNGGNSFGATSSLGNLGAYSLNLITNGANRLTIDSLGNVGIGTTSPGAQLDVSANSTGYSIRGVNSNVSGSGIYAAVTNTSNTGSAGYFSTASFSGQAIYAANTSSGGNAIYASGTTAILGNGGAGGGGGAGVEGSNSANGSGNYGIWGNATGTGAVAGVYAVAAAGSNTGFAVQAVNNSATGWGIYSSGTSPNYFAGSVGVGTTTPGAVLDAYATGALSAIIVPRDASTSRPTTPVNGMIRYATDTNKFEAYQNGSWQNIIGGGGSVTSVVSGTGLTTGTIAANGTLNVDVGTLANQIVQLDSSARLPQVDGGLIANINAVKLQGTKISTSAPTGSQVLTYNSTTTQWEAQNPSAAGNSWVNGGNSFGATSSLGNLGAYSLNLITNGANRLTIDALGNVGIGTSTPTNILSLDGQAAHTIWMERETTAATAGKDLSIQAGGAASGGTNLAGGNLYLKSGTATGTGKGNIYFQTAPASAGTPGTADAAPNTIMEVTYNGVGIGPFSANLSSITNFPYQVLDVAGSEILYGSGSGANGAALTFLNQDGAYGWGNHMTAANEQLGKIQFDLTDTGWVTDIGAQIDVVAPNTSTGTYAGTMTFQTAVSGTLAPRMTIYNGNVGIGTATPAAILDVYGVGTLQSAMIVPRDTTANRPTVAVGGMIRYATDTGKFEAYQGGSWQNLIGGGGSVTSVVSGNGLIAGTITAIGTINVDAGTLANQIVQLDGSARLPQVDGGLVSNINAVKLQARAVSAAAPGVGQILGWNNLSSQWEPTLAATGSVTSVVSGTGLTAGTITANGTLNVDVGTLAGKIVQLDGSARLPQVDGGLVTNVNAVKIQGTKISATAPTASQVLTYNSTTAQWEAENVSAAGNAWINGGNSFGATSSLGNLGAYSLNLITNGANRLTIDSLGNVGIGTTSPTNLLSLDGQAAHTIWMERETTAATAGKNLTLQAGGAKAAGTNLAGGNLYLSSGTATGNALSAIYLQVPQGFTSGTADNSPTTQVTVDTSGLAVAAGSVTATVSYSTPYTASSGSAVAPPGAANGGPVLMAQNNNSLDSAGSYVTFYAQNTNGNAQQAYIGSISTTGSAVYSPSIVFGHQSGSNAYNEYMRIGQNGNVGIGSTTPQTKLDVNGSVKVGADATACSATIQGAIHLNGTALEYCNGTAWTAFTTGGAGTYLPESGGGTVAGNVTITPGGGTALTITNGGASIAGATSLTGGATISGGALAMSAQNITGVGSNLTGSSALTIAAGGTAQNLILNSSTTGSVNFGTGNGQALSVIDSGATTNDYLTIQGGTTASPNIALSAAGSDANVGMNFSSQGTGNIRFFTGGGKQVLISNAANAVNYFQIAGAATGSAPIMTAQGADTNVSIGFVAKGTGWNTFSNGNGMQFSIVDPGATTVNYLSVKGAATGFSPSLSVANSSDTNVNISIVPKGSGSTNFTGNVGIGTTSPNQALSVVGNANASGYLYVGSNGTPTNTTAGDLTSSRMFVGNGALIADEVLNVQTSISDTTGTGQAAYIKANVNPGSASSAEFRSLYMSSGINTAQSLATVDGGWFEVRSTSAASATQVNGVKTFGLVLAGSAVNFGTISDANGVYAEGVSSFSNVTTGTISNARGVRVANSTVINQTLTNQAGVSIDALSGATNNTSLLIGTSSIPSGNYGIYNSSASNNYFAGNVGIGTTSPAGLLEVIASTKNANNWTHFNGNVGTFNPPTSMASGGLAVGWNLSNGNGESNLVWGTGTGANPALTFATWNGSSVYSELMRIQPSGNVGIGTTSPGATLDIAGQFRTSNTTATVGTCGTSPSITGTDQSGKVTMGSGALTACTISFHATLTNAPASCVLFPANATAAATSTTGAYISSVTTSGFVVTGSNLTSAAYWYHCY